MRYNIGKASSPKMPNLRNRTECIKILLSQVSKDVREPLVPMLFPILGAHLSGAEFQYPDRSWKEMCGLMVNLVAESGGNKGQLSHLVEAFFARTYICRLPEATLADSPRLHLHTPGINICRLRRQQIKVKS